MWWHRRSIGSVLPLSSTIVPLLPQALRLPVILPCLLVAYYWQLTTNNFLLISLNSQHNPSSFKILQQRKPATINRSIYKIKPLRVTPSCPALCPDI